MNNDRRKEIKEVVAKVEKLFDAYKASKGNADTFAKVKEDYEDAKNEMSMIIGEEEDAYDRLSEGLQESERGEYMQECIDAMTEYEDWLSEIVDNMDNLEHVVGAIDEEQYNTFFNAIGEYIRINEPSLKCCF